jgi:thiamine-monophosphate kinase
MGTPIKINRPFYADDMPKWLSTFNASNSFPSNVIAGINDDDCAIIQTGSEQIIITTDYLNASPIALEFGIGGYWDLGRILVASNLSDLCGTGALPIAFLTSIMLNKDTASESNFKDLMSGVKHELDKYNIPLVGGDTKLGKADNFCGIAVGVKRKNSKLIIKNAATAGDYIWVSGNLGGVAAAIEGLNLKKMSSQWNEWAKKKIIDPQLPMEKSESIALSMLGKGGTDISDGLGANLWNLCEASNVGAIIYAESIPMDKQVVEIAHVTNYLPWMYSLTIGGDFQFLFTSDPQHEAALTDMGFIKIGLIIEEHDAFIEFKQNKIKMPKIGHRDIRKQSFSEEVGKLILNIQSQL